MHSVNLDVKYKMSNVINIVLTDENEPFISCNCSRRKLQEGVNAFCNDDFTRGKQKATIFSWDLICPNSIQWIQLEALVPF